MAKTTRANLISHLVSSLIYSSWDFNLLFVQLKGKEEEKEERKKSRRRRRRRRTRFAAGPRELIMNKRLKRVPVKKGLLETQTRSMKVLRTEDVSMNSALHPIFWKFSKKKKKSLKHWKQHPNQRPINNQSKSLTDY